MTEPERVCAALLERYRGLNCALKKQLDDITFESVQLETLRQTLREWLAVAKDPSLPPGVHYLLDTEPTFYPVNPTKGTRNELVVDSLREIARDEDVEIFLAVFEFGRSEDEARLTHMADRHGNNIYEFFITDKQEVLRDYTVSPKNEDHFGTILPPTESHATCVAILPTSKVLDKKHADPGPTEADILRLREHMICYLVDRALDKADVVKATSELQSYYWRPVQPGQGDFNPLQWPHRATKRHLLNAVTMATRAAAIPYEPPPYYFDYFANKALCFSPGLFDDSDIIRGLDILLSQVDFADLPRVLSNLPPLVQGEPDRHDPAYVGRWLHRVFARSHCGPQVYLRLEHATLIVDMCTSFFSARVHLSDVICDILRYQCENPPFCFALIGRLLEVSYEDPTDLAYIKCWQCFEGDVLHRTNTSRMAKHRSPSAGLLPRFPTASSWENRPLLSQPLGTAVPTTVSKIQYLLDRAQGQEWEPACGGFLTWIENQFENEVIHEEGNDGKTLTAFWLPMIRDLSQRHDASFWEPEPSPRREVHRDIIRAVLIRYLKVCVGAEPRRRDFYRPSLVTPECKGCASCKVINRFLLDISRTRAIFPVARTTPPVTSSPGTSSGYVIQRSALAHILPETKKMGCSFHIKERTCAGTVLCVEKRDGAKQWVDWCARREEAARELARFDPEKMILVLGKKDYESLVGMEILKRDNRADWFRMIETYLGDTETQRAALAPHVRRAARYPWPDQASTDSDDLTPSPLARLSRLGPL
ncbi:hypothetical protein VPNG_00939 [Cytospora leucostoma]|uniref:Uncharacterized protein n=1 Tax=Cytospora leucostoma TaxID=1230097 RepID=A0A423XME5_9PEZI|nr:hypothetical protein VPNG_00939 [Cytospora leucostoma]